MSVKREFSERNRWRPIGVICVPCRKNRQIVLDHVIDLVFPIICCAHFERSRFSQRLAKLRVCGPGGNGGTQSLRKTVARHGRDQDSAVRINVVGRPAPVRGNDWQALAHGFKDDGSPAFIKGIED